MVDVSKLKNTDDHFMAPDEYFVNFDNLNVPTSPNTWLVAPADFEPAELDATAPVFDVPAARLAQAWCTVVEANRGRRS